MRGQENEHKRRIRGGHGSIERLIKELNQLTAVSHQYTTPDEREAYVVNYKTALHVLRAHPFCSHDILNPYVQHLNEYRGK